MNTLSVNTLSAKQGVTYQGFLLLDNVVHPQTGEVLYSAFTAVPLRVIYDLANLHGIFVTNSLTIIAPEDEVSNILRIQQKCIEVKAVDWVESEDSPGIFHPVFAS